MKLQMKPHDYNGKLFVFCGLDGSGKTTQINLLKLYLEEKGYSVYITKQPTEAVRNTVIFRTFTDCKNNDDYDYLSLSLLCASDRVQHSNREIIPLLKEGKIVICDRYYYSCLANLLARGYNNQKWIYEIAQSIPRPDAAIFMDIDVETAIQRVRSRPNEKDRIINISFQQKLRNHFINIANENDGTIIDSNDSVENCFQNIKSIVKGVIDDV